MSFREANRPNFGSNLSKSNRLNYVNDHNQIKEFVKQYENANGEKKYVEYLKMVAGMLKVLKGPRMRKRT